MDKIKLINQLKLDEGVKLKVYKDIFGNLTVGVGHLVAPKDNLKLNDEITEEQCDQFLMNDLKNTLDSCYKLFARFDYIPESAQQVIANMMFNLGYGNLSQFKNFIKAVNDKNYNLAGDSMQQSLWYAQVGIRSKRLVKEMKDTQ